MAFDTTPGPDALHRRLALYPPGPNGLPAHWCLDAVQRTFYGLAYSNESSSLLPTYMLVYYQGSLQYLRNNRVLRQYFFMADALEGFILLRGGATEADVIAYAHDNALPDTPADAVSVAPDAPWPVRGVNPLPHTQAPSRGVSQAFC